MPRLTFRSKNRRFGRLAIFAILLLVFFPQTAYADVYTVTKAEDFFFELSEDQQFTARTYAQQYSIDSHLWLYNSEDTLIASNDDYFGLDSFIQMDLPAGTYRMRAGVCCGDPTRWYGESYTLDMTSQAITIPTTTVEFPSNTDVPPVSSVPTTEQPVETTTSSILDTTTTTEESTTTTQASTTIPEVPTTTQRNTTTTALMPTTTTSTTVPPTSSIQSYVPLTTVPIVTPVASTTTSIPSRTTLPETPTTSSTISLVPSTTTSTETTTLASPPITSVPEVTTTTTPSIFEEAPPAKLEQFFETLNMSALTDEEKEKFVEEISNASDEVKKTFEDSVNIYSGEFEEYVPTGSVVSVRQRKVIIAATGVLFVAPTISTSPPSAPPSGSPSGGSPSDSPSGSDTKSDSKSRKHRRGKK